MRKIGSFLVMLIILCAIFYTTQQLGRYLISEISLEKEQLTEQIKEEKKMILHLPTEKYYVIQMGIFSKESDRDLLMQEMKAKGYDVLINHKEPYVLWLGCIGEKEKDSSLIQLSKEYPDATLSEMVLNNTSFAYWEKDRFKGTKVMSFICNCDVLLKHSLKTFSSFDIASYDSLLLGEMLTELEKESSKLLQELYALELEQTAYAVLTADIKKAIEAYREDIVQLKEEQTTENLRNAQNKLAYLIMQYHTFIDMVSDR